MIVKTKNYMGRVIGFLYAKDKSWYSDIDKDLIRNAKPEECHFMKTEYYEVNI